MVFDKKDLRYNADGFFDFRGWLKLLEINYKKDTHTLIITAVRNMGKTVALWRFIEEYWKEFNYERKVAICRNNDIRMKESINSFKAAFRDKYEVIGGFIYAIELDEKTKKVIPESRIEIGRFVNIENQHNYKSGADGGFKNYHLVFWDEFNEDVQTSLNFYEKFVNLNSTIERFNNPYQLILIGNKVNANNDIFIYLNLKTRRNNYDEDYVQKVDDDITYLDIGFNTYKHLKQNGKSMTERLATFNPNTDRFFNRGGFLDGVIYNVANRLNFINSYVKYIFSLGNYLVEYGEFYNEEFSKEKLYFIRHISTFKDYMLNNANVVALDVAGYSAAGCNIDKNDLVDLADMLFLKTQQKTLFYESFELMNVFQPWIFRYTSLFDGKLR